MQMCQITALKNGHELHVLAAEPGEETSRRTHVREKDG